MSKPAAVPNEEIDLKVAEWQVLIQNPPPPPTKNFRATRVGAPLVSSRASKKPFSWRDCARCARYWLTRIESKGDFADAAYVDDGRETPLSLRKSNVAARIRGSRRRIFSPVKGGRSPIMGAGGSGSKTRSGIPSCAQSVACYAETTAAAGFPNIRLILLHCLHALMRQIALECGYTAAACENASTAGTSARNMVRMAGILIYTAASDSEGTLGGLVQLGQPISR